MSATYQTMHIEKAVTSKIIHVYIENTGGTGLTGLTDATANLVAFFVREGDSGSTQLTLGAGTLGAFGTAGDFKEVDATNLPGVYQLSLDNAMLSDVTGEEYCKLMLQGAASMEDCIVDIYLDKIDYVNGRIDLKSTGIDQIVIETGLNARQALSIIAAAVGGIVSGAETASVTFKAAKEGSTTRILATIDVDGNRSVVTLSLPA